MTEDEPELLRDAASADALDAHLARFEAALAAVELRGYRPHPLGSPIAREAIARHDGSDANAIALAPSPDASLRRAFAAMADRGDEILAPHTLDPNVLRIAQALDVHLVQFPGFGVDDPDHVDLRALFDLISDRTRAIYLADPSAPLGGVLSADTSEAFASLELPLIVDRRHRRLALAELEPAPRIDATLCFVVEGLRERGAAPGLGLGWTTVSGDPARVDEAIAHLEGVAQTEPLACAPIELAMEDLLRACETAKSALLDHLRANDGVLSEAARASAGPIEHTTPRAGHRATLVRRGPSRGWSDELARGGARVASGERFGIDDADAVVVSLHASRDAIARLAARLDDRD
ncbi:MAG: aminotransferase class I/II-fold pyridoxal phosphate-dependent enzyme [Sandaracinaceae bacterium]